MNDDEILEAAFDSERFRAQGHALVDVMADYLARVRSDDPPPVVKWLDPDPMAEHWPAEFEARPDVDIGEHFERVLEHSIHHHHPRYVGHQVAAPVPIAALADMAAGILNNGMAAYDSGPVSVVMERASTRYMANALGWPKGGGVITSGGTLGNFTALLGARQAIVPGDAWTEGTDGTKLAVIGSEQAHYCVSRAALMMGWGEGATKLAPVDASYRMRVDALPGLVQQAEDEGRRVVAVVANAGTTTTGAFDPLSEIAAFCREKGLWLHVDGAHGASLALCAKYRDRLRGVEEADSIVWDAHKVMALPALVTAVLFRDEERSYDVFSQRASYLFEPGDAREQWFNLAMRTVECTKTMMSLKLYTALRMLGTDFFDAHITRSIELTRAFADRIAADPRFELAVEPECNIVCFRYQGGEFDDTQRDAMHYRVRGEIVRAGEWFVSRAVLGGRVFFRTTLLNPRTTEAELGRLLDYVAARFEPAGE